MNHRIDIYLDQVMAYAGLPSTEATAARNELADHLISRVADLEKAGATHDDAVFRAIYDLGQPSEVGYGLRPSCPWIDVRFQGTARGIFAVGPKAVGVFACGIVSTGVVSCGVVSFGVLSAGLLAFGLFFGIGGVSTGSISLGLNALGLIAVGLNSAGILSAGLNSVGVWVFSGRNALSFFDENTVPFWLQQMGFMISWNNMESAVALLPLIVVFSLLVVVAIAIGTREYRRINNYHHWMLP